MNMIDMSRCINSIYAMDLIRENYDFSPTSDDDDQTSEPLVLIWGHPVFLTPITNGVKNM
jgi:hypothetical protein